MTFHDLGTLGTADVVPKKSLLVRINVPWEKFSLKYAAELADLSTGTIAVLQQALISKSDVKIKKEGDELDRFFTKVEAAQKNSPYMSVLEERAKAAPSEEPKVQQEEEGLLVPAIIEAPKYLEVKEFVSTVNEARQESYDLKAGEDNEVYVKITVKNVSDAKLTKLQVKKGIPDGFSDVVIQDTSSGMAQVEQGFISWILEELEANSEAFMGVRMVAKIATKNTQLKSGPINATCNTNLVAAEEERYRKREREEAKRLEDLRQQEEEKTQLAKLQKLIHVSNRLKRGDIARYLHLPDEVLFDRLVDWAERFGFKLDGEDVVFIGGHKDDFIAALDEEFRTWGQIKEKKV